MKIGQTFYTADRNEWRQWLEANHEEAGEIWLLLPKKSSGKPSLEYNTAVEEALCFGWIDSTRKAYDRDTSAQRFSPRKRGSPYSQANKERIKWLARADKLHPSMRPVAEQVMAEEFVFPPDIMAAIRADERAWQHFRAFSPAYQRIRVAYVDGARKRPGEFEKRLANLVKTAAANQRIGYGGIDKHY